MEQTRICEWSKNTNLQMEPRHESANGDVSKQLNKDTVCKQSKDTSLQMEQRHESANGAKIQLCEWSKDTNLQMEQRHESANGDASKQFNKDTSLEQTEQRHESAQVHGNTSRRFNK